MYTVPAVTNIQTKQLIASFEKGQLDVVTNGEAEDAHAEGVNAGGVKVNRELSVEELAQPGTARRLLQEFEARSKQSLKAEVLVRGSAHRAAANNRHSAGATLISVQETNPSVTIQPVADTSVVIVAKEGEAKLDLDVTTSKPVESSVSQPPVIETVPPFSAPISVEPAESEPGVHQTLNFNDAQKQVVETLDAVIESGERTLLVEEVQKVEPVEEPKLVASKNVLIVHAIRDRVPLHDALVEKTLEAIKSKGHSVTATDLSKFTATSSNDEDLTQLKASLKERHKVADADLLIVVYQPLFNSVPSSLQAWIEAVFSIDQQTNYTNKKVIVLLTTPQQKEDFDSSSVHGDLASYLNPPQVSVLRQLGFDVLKPHAIFGTGESDADAILGQWVARLTSIIDETA